ncbi:MAG: UDP-N-acetylmuramoyl-L-alanine--D-glutamate ligase [Crocinitomicaceae bacterium]|nr:UDP-N-acetylmuramoyl-L-alanine--D-glutamate ligase [Crocinitomicaceae bacterium]
MSKDILILGAGESGVGAAKLALTLGHTPFVSDAGEGKAVFLAELDAEGIRYEVGGHNPGVWPKVKTVVKSPGIPEDDTIVEDLRDSGVEVISEIEYASRHYSGKVIAITGANGKTTTTALIYKILSDAGVNAICVGNIGTSWAREMSERKDSADVVVVETSSFQLDGTTTFKPDVAILLNITPDHLDRYGYSLENYAKSKWRITANQTSDDYLVYNADDEVIADLLKTSGTKAQLMPVSAENTIEESSVGAGLNAANKEEFLIYTHNTKPFNMTIQELALQGKHNLFNSMAAGVTSRILELRNEGIRESLKNFEGIEHRLEYVADVNQIRFINDSKATNVNSVWYALECMDRPLVWIVGGIDKGNDYRDLLPLVKEKVKHMVCLGKDNKKLIKTFSKHVETVHVAETAEEAVRIGYDLGMPNDVVLLSPACASFDLFGSYEERGNKFKQAVRGL